MWGPAQGPLIHTEEGSIVFRIATTALCIVRSSSWQEAVPRDVALLTAIVAGELAPPVPATIAVASTCSATTVVAVTPATTSYVSCLGDAATSCITP